MSLSSIIHLPLFPYAYALAVFFLGAFFVCCVIAFCAFSCAFRYVGAFSHGLDRCTISFRLDVVSLADNGCARGIAYLIRYAFPSSPCSLRCFAESCLKLALHSRHVTWYLVILFLQWTGADGVAGVATVTLP